MKQKHFIDSHKAATGPAVLLMMALHNQWENPTAWVYLALHGTYGLLWVLKSRIFPDKTWEQKTGWGYGLVIWGGLTLYWVAPWILTSQEVQAPAGVSKSWGTSRPRRSTPCSSGPRDVGRSSFRSRKRPCGDLRGLDWRYSPKFCMRPASAWYLGMCVSLYALGVFSHYAADMQKHVALKLRPGQLIADGLMAHCRNINYFGESLIYLGFGLLAMHWLPMVILGLFIAVVWLPNMRRKDKSLARYPEFETYRRRSKLFIPFVL